MHISTGKAYAAGNRRRLFKRAIFRRQLPVDNALVGSRKGEASMSEILCCFATGNASVTRAAQDAGISKIKTVEHEYFNVLLIYQSYTTYVTGDK